MSKTFFFFFCLKFLLSRKGLGNWEELKKFNQDADQIQQRKLDEELIQKAHRNKNASDHASNDSKLSKKPLLTSRSKKYSSPLKVG